MNISQNDLEICLNVLQQISEQPSLINQHQRLRSLITKIIKSDKKSKKLAEKEKLLVEDQNLIASTLMVQQHQEKSAILPTKTLPVRETLNQSITCYSCNKKYNQIHFLYHRLCPECADINYQKRSQRADLTDRIALVTGGRIKIGYQIALRMLRDGARVILTTRFPQDCALRFSKEPDFSELQKRLQIYGLDLRNLIAVESFVRYLLATESFLDIIINNAAQTIKRPLEFYQHLLVEEQKPLNTLPIELQNLIVNSANEHPHLLETRTNYRSDLPAVSNTYFPANSFDEDGQQIDLRPTNSWVLKLDEVSTMEMLEVQLVNNIAPFIFNSKLKQLMLKSPFSRRFIINVSAMEGQFNRENKTIYHPHTNMAKAALNMMTRTSAADYARDGIFMNSVDTGWVTDENPHPKKTHIQTKRGFYPPLDIIDGMARIYDPIVQGINNPQVPLYGHFLKDYTPYPW